MSMQLMPALQVAGVGEGRGDQPKLVGYGSVGQGRVGQGRVGQDGEMVWHVMAWHGIA